MRELETALSYARFTQAIQRRPCMIFSASWHSHLPKGESYKWMNRARPTNSLYSSNKKGWWSPWPPWHPYAACPSDDPEPNIRRLNRSIDESRSVLLWNQPSLGAKVCTLNIGQNFGCPLTWAKKPFKKQVSPIKSTNGRWAHPATFAVGGSLLGSCS